MAISDTHQVDQHRASQLYCAPEVKIINGVAIKFSTVQVHEFRMGDVEDPDLYAAGPILDWEKSPAGAWVMAHAVEVPYWVRAHDQFDYAIKYRIMARLSEPDLLFFKLKFS
jgi:hypothetical protein